MSISIRQLHLLLVLAVSGS